MENIKKMQIVFVMCLCFIILLFTMLFAFHSNRLNQKNSYNRIESCHLMFSDLSVATVGNSSYQAPTIYKNSFQNFQITLNNLNDKVIFRFKINNDGGTPCQITRIKESLRCKKNENKDICKSLRYLLQYENGNSISVGDVLSENSSYYAKFVVEYPKDLMEPVPIVVDGEILKIYYQKK